MSLESHSNARFFSMGSKMHFDRYPKTGGSCAIYVWKRTTLMSFLVVLPSVLRSLWSMWHILVRLVDGWREIWGSCAIYVGIPSLILANEWELRHLCPKKAAWCWKKWGGNQRSANFPLGFAPENGPHQVSSFLWETQEKALFRGTWRGPFSGAKQSGKLPEHRRWQKIGHF